MAKTPKPIPPKNADDKKQSEQFIDTALELETDETGRDLERAFKKIAKAQPEPKSPTRSSRS